MDFVEARTLFNFGLEVLETDLDDSEQKKYFPRPILVSTEEWKETEGACGYRKHNPEDSVFCTICNRVHISRTDLGYLPREGLIRALWSVWAQRSGRKGKGIQSEIGIRRLNRNLEPR